MEIFQCFSADKNQGKKLTADAGKQTLSEPVTERRAGRSDLILGEVRQTEYLGAYQTAPSQVLHK